MDSTDFDPSGLNNSTFVAAMRKNFELSPRKPLPHHIDTMQQPEDRPDFGLWSTLGGLATNYGIAGIVIAALLVALLNR